MWMPLGCMLNLPWLFIEIDQNSSVSKMAAKGGTAMARGPVLHA